MHYLYVDMARVSRGEPGLVIRPEGCSRTEVSYARRVELAPGVFLVQREARDPVDGTMVRIETSAPLSYPSPVSES